jgi:hypothetical protein
MATSSSHKCKNASKIFEDCVSQMNIQQQQEEALQARWARVQEARREHSSQQIQELQARRKRIQQTLETLDAYIDARIRKIETLDLELES